MAQIAALMRYPRRASSSRLRHCIFFDALRSATHEIIAQSFFDEAYLDRLYGVRRRLRPDHFGRFYGRRLRRLRSLPASSVLWIEKELFPFLPARLEERHLRRFKGAILDLDDAWFLRYETHRSTAVRKLLGDKYRRLLGAVDVVTVPNRFLAEEVLNRGARRVVMVPPSIDVDKYRPRGKAQRAGPVTIGWIGTPPNARIYLPPLVGVLNALTRADRVRVILVGAGVEVPQLIAERRAWSEATEARDVADFDIGIMPLLASVWDRCKSGFKLLQTMASGIPVVASNIGFNQVLVTDGLDGRLVGPDAPCWRQALDDLIDDPAARRRMGGNARAKVVAEFSEAPVAARLAALFREFD